MSALWSYVQRQTNSFGVVESISTMEMVWNLKDAAQKGCRKSENGSSGDHQCGSAITEPQLCSQKKGQHGPYKGAHSCDQLADEENIDFVF